MINTEEKTVRINTSGLQEGHYILKIVYKDAVLTKQVMIK
jgi:hypothetical protein